MGKSRLESYESILRVLIRKPLTVDSIAYEINMDCIILRQRLDFLIKNSLVEETTYKNKKFYAATKRGASVYKTLNLTKRLEKLETSIRIIDEALQAIPNLSEYVEGKKKRNRKNENY